jgi:hypothetical protein
LWWFNISKSARDAYRASSTAYTRLLQGRHRPYNGPAKTALPLCTRCRRHRRIDPARGPLPHHTTPPHGHRVNGTPLKRAGLIPPPPTLFRSLYRAPVLQRIRRRRNTNSARTSSSFSSSPVLRVCVSYTCINIDYNTSAQLHLYTTLRMQKRNIFYWIQGTRTVFSKIRYVCYTVLYTANADRDKT